MTDERSSKHKRKTSIEPSAKKAGISATTDGVAAGLPSLVITEDGPVDDDVLVHPHLRLSQPASTNPNSG